MGGVIGGRGGFVLPGRYDVVLIWRRVAEKKVKPWGKKSAGVEGGDEKEVEEEEEVAVWCSGAVGIASAQPACSKSKHRSFEGFEFRV